MVENTINRRLSFFHQEQEKIPLEKLNHLIVWMSKFYAPYGKTPNVKHAFDQFFLRLLPHCKQKMEEDYRVPFEELVQRFTESVLL